MKVIDIDLNLIDQNENSRVIYKENDLSELMASMKLDGLLQPIGVRVIEKGRYDCVFGNRRLMAAKRLGWMKIPASLQERTDEKARDILNLIENVKRQSTTVAEDGRMFCKLMEHGLTKGEVAARLGISLMRVDTAIDVFKEFPQEFRKVIMNSSQGTRQRAGRISASAAFHVNTIRKSHDLTRKQTREILNYAKQDGVSMAQVSSIGPLIGAGMKIQKAIESVEKLSVITLSILVDNRYVAKLEKDTGKSIHDTLYESLEKKFTVSRAGSSRRGMDGKRDPAQARA